MAILGSKGEFKRKYRTYFDNFNELSYNNLKIRVMPMSDNIPEITKISYDEEADIFEVNIAGKAFSTHEIKLDHNFTVICNEQDGRIVGFIITSFSDVIQKAVEQAISNIDWDSLLKDERKKWETKLSDLDIENRKVRFFGDVVSNPSSLEWALSG